RPRPRLARRRPAPTTPGDRPAHRHQARRHLGQAQPFRAGRRADGTAEPPAQRNSGTGAVMTKDIRFACWAGIAGTLFGVLAILLTGTPGSPFPMWEWPTQNIYAYFDDANPLAVRAQYFLIGTGITLMPFFAAGLTQVLRQGTRTTV